MCQFQFSWGRGVSFSEGLTLAIFQREWMWACGSEELKIVVREGAQMGGKSLIIQLEIPFGPMDLFSFMPIK